VTASGQDASDNANECQGGFRLDWEPATENKLTLQGDFFADRAVENQDMPALLPPYSQNFDEVNHDNGGNVLGRWAHDFSESSSLTVQAYYDHLKHGEGGATELVDTADFDAQHRFALLSQRPAFGKVVRLPLNLCRRGPGFAALPLHRRAAVSVGLNLFRDDAPEARPATRARQHAG